MRRRSVYPTDSRAFSPVLQTSAGGGWTRGCSRRGEGEGDEVEELLAKQAGLLVFPLRGFRPLQGRSGCNPSDCTLLAGSVAWGCLVVACGRHGHTGFGQTKDEASEDQDQALRKI
eukprot:jgi/Tetstr1/457178/TSEL_043827.t1